MLLLEFIGFLTTFRSQTFNPFRAICRALREFFVRHCTFSAAGYCAGSEMAQSSLPASGSFLYHALIQRAVRISGDLFPEKIEKIIIL